MSLLSRTLLLVPLLVCGHAAAESPAVTTLHSPSRVPIAGGSFLMGAQPEDLQAALALCAEAEGQPCEPARFAHETPAHRVYVASFAIDLTEVSVSDYGRCRDALRCPPTSISDSDGRLAKPDQPVTGVTFAAAQAYCAFVGGRLPTEAEWERAARGASARRFPWGNLFNSRLANHGPADAAKPIDGYRFTAPVDAFPDGRSAYGLLNMAGNVWEWTADHYAADAYGSSPAVDPSGPKRGDKRVIRGGSYESPAEELRVTARAALDPEAARPDVGFRCAY